MDIAGGWRLYHSECVHCRQYSAVAGVERLQRHESRCAFVRAVVDNGLEGASHSRERGEPGLYRHAPMAFQRRGRGTHEDDFEQYSARQVRHTR